MSKLLRHYSEGNIYFVTVVTNNRENLLIKHHDLLRDSVNKYKIELKFSVIAHVVLPDHFHVTIDPKENSLSSIIQKVKLSFSKKVRYRLHANSGHIWQSRFWDHIIRNQDDMNRHIDYIHYNPVKHGFVQSPFDWGQSSIYEYFKEGHYSRDWGVSGALSFEGDYGE